MLKRSLAVIAVALLVVVGCASDSGRISQEEADAAAERAAEDALAEERAQQAEDDAAALEEELDALREQVENQPDGDAEAPGGGGATTGGGATGGNTGGGNTVTAGLSYCTPNVAVNSVTSCPFAMNVVESIQVEGLVFDAWSPTTQQWYSMSCVDYGDAVECTGGNNARVVYIP